MMRAVILAAGCGSRLADVTDKPKCLLEIGGETLLHRQLRLLKDNGCTPTIVLGYKPEVILREIKDICSIAYNPLWKQSNTLVSVLFGINGIYEDTLIINGDVIFQEDLIPQVLNNSKKSIAAGQILKEPTPEEVKVLYRRGKVSQIGKGINSDIEAVGVYLFTGALLKDMSREVERMENPFSAYYEDAVNRALDKHEMELYLTNNAYEIDTQQDLINAKEYYDG